MVHKLLLAWTRAGVHLGLTDVSCRCTRSICTACFVVWRPRRAADTPTNRRHGFLCRHTTATGAVRERSPRYLADFCVPTASTDGRRQSSSAVSGALLVPLPWTLTSTGQRSFAAYDPMTWNRLPTALRSPKLALFIQAPAQDPLVCSSTRQCWLQL